MIIAILILLVTTLLIGAAYDALQGDARVAQHDLDGKRAYYAARAGINAYLYQVNQNPSYWTTCANDTQATTPVPGSTTGEQYSYAPVLANGATSCSSADPVSSLIDTSTGTLRMKFVGYSGNPQTTRGIIASFRKDSPLDFLWFSVYEALDQAISGYSGCGVYYRVGGRPSGCNITFVSGDSINGPMYTQDQFMISGSPTLGRSVSDRLESAAPGTTNSAICTNNNCGSAVINGTPVPGAPMISLPSSSTTLQTDATKYGKTYNGTTTITLNGNQATVVNCPTSSCTTTTVSLTQYPILYVNNASGCTPYSYTPFSITYPTTGCTGDVYVSGNYTSPVTIGAANNIIINGALTTNETAGLPSGTSTLGLVANQFIRVMHGVTTRSAASQAQCGTATNVSGQTLSNLKIDAAVLAMQDSFIVDNYDCGASLGTLTINGAIVQKFRGTVGMSSGATTGYLKNYTYDNRLAVLLPPYLFDIVTSGWHMGRETLCTPGGIDANAC